MSDIYKLINPETGEEQLLVSKEYVDLRIRALKDAFSSHIKNIDNAHSDINDDTVKSAALLDNAEFRDLVFKEENRDIPAENILTDAEHRFITQTQLDTFKSKPTAHEVETLVNNYYNSIKNTFNEMYARLLNMPNAVSKLREISKLVSNDSVLTGLVEDLEEKVSIEDFEQHTESYMHLTNSDRSALNILLELIKDGTIDKINDISLDYSRNAYTASHLNDKTYDEVRSRGKYIKVYSIAGENNSMADIYLPANSDLSSSSLIQNIYSLNGFILFLSGNYKISEFDIDRIRASKGTLTIDGCGTSTKFISDNMTCNYISFSNCNINADFLIVKNDVTFNNVEFNECYILLEDSNNCKFIDCTFNNCKIAMKKVCRYNRFRDCLFNRTNIPKYVGTTNTFTGSIETI